MSEPSKPPLNLVNWEVVKVIFDKPPGLRKGEFNIEIFQNSSVAEDKKDFLCTFIVSLKSKNETAADFTLTVECHGQFTITDQVSDKILENFVNVSAPMIMYPYLRAFITTFTANSGMDPIILPSISYIPWAPKKESETEAKEPKA